MQKITIDLKVTPEQLNLALIALAQLPYSQVVELINTIESQAGPQLLDAKNMSTNSANVTAVKSS